MKEEKKQKEKEWYKKWIRNQAQQGICIKCKEKTVVRYYCQKHRDDLSRRRRVSYLEEKFKKKYGVT